MEQWGVTFLMNYARHHYCSATRIVIRNSSSCHPTSARLIAFEYFYTNSFLFIYFQWSQNVCIFVLRIWSLCNHAHHGWSLPSRCRFLIYRSTLFHFMHQNHHMQRIVCHKICQYFFFFFKSLPAFLLRYIFITCILWYVAYFFR